MKKAQGQSEQEFIDQSRRSGRRLAEAFLNGALVPNIAVQLAMQPGESCVGQMPVMLYQFIEGDGSYVKHTGGWSIGGGIVGAVISTAAVTSNAIGNANRRARAAREAAGQWRHIDTGTVYLTSRRWSLNSSNTWVDWWFDGVRMSHCDGKMICLELVGNPKTGLVVPDPDYWYVMFNKLAYDKVVMPPLPSDGQHQLSPNHQVRDR